MADTTPLPHRYFDDKERKDTTEALKALPADHPAHAAFRLGVGPLALTNVVGAEYAEVVNRLRSVYLDAHRRMLSRHSKQ